MERCGQLEAVKSYASCQTSAAVAAARFSKAANRRVHVFFIVVFLMILYLTAGGSCRTMSSAFYSGRGIGYLSLIVQQSHSFLERSARARSMVLRG